MRSSTRSRPSLLPFLISALLGTAVLPASAEGLQLPPWLQLEGYATLSTYHADDQVASYRPDARNARSGKAGEWRWDGDSMAALQLSADMGRGSRVVWQLQAKDDAAARWRPHTEWLFASWELDADSSFKAGRLVLPVFLLSETRNVGYAQPNARPVNTVYQLNPISTLDGISFQSSTSLAGGQASAELLAGRRKIELAIGHIDARFGVVATAGWRRGPLLLRGTGASFKLDVDLPSTEAVLALASSGATDCSNCQQVLAARNARQGIRASMWSAAAVLEQGPLTWQFEVTERLSNSSVIPDSRGWYLLASWRQGAWTPSISHGRVRFLEPPLGLQTAAGAGATALAFNNALDRYLQNPGDRQVWQLGLRRELSEKMALKLQYERLKQTRETHIGQLNGMAVYPLAAPLGSYLGPDWDGRMNVVSISLDLVF